MQIWKAHYKDDCHDTIIDLINTEEEYKNDPLRFLLDGIKFQGTGLGDFRLADATQYGESKKKFCILKVGGYKSGGKEVPYWYQLQKYFLDVEIPVKAIRKLDNMELQAVIHISFGYYEHDNENNQARMYCDDTLVFYDDEKVYDFTLYVDGKKYSSTKRTLYFEKALLDICKQMADDFYLRCCFTCQYSDYSPYGCDDYGTMLCYRRHKEDYLKVNNKDEYFEYLEGKDFEMRQETYLCEEYELRNRCQGYRGYVAGGNCS